MKKRAVLIAGPTASGKSGFAMALAKKIDGVIVNSDSMQVYEGLRVLTARPSAADEAEVPHRLYGHVSADTRYSVGAWLRDVTGEIEKIESTGKTPILVGGTGLYFKALTEGLATMPEFTPEQFEQFIAGLAEHSTESLQQRLQLEDPESAARIERGDRQRTLRALMVLELSGQSLTDWQKTAQANATLPLNQTVPVVLMPKDRQWLYDRINTRFEKMVREDDGSIEARTLLERNLPPHLPIMSAIGMPHFYQLVVERRYPVMDEIVGKSKRDTRRYAKRQMTWFRNQMAHWPRLDPMTWEQDMDKMLKDLEQITQELEKQG